MFDFFATILSLIDDFLFYKKNKKERKGKTVKPLAWAIVVLLIIVSCLQIVNFFIKDDSAYITKKEIGELKVIIENEKKANGKYPNNLEQLTRKNPLRFNLTKDKWGNTYYYKTFNNNNSYQIISLGEDGKFNTRDDITSD